MTFEHVPYDWSDPAPLAAALNEATRQDAVAAISSEGGLFEYGSDEHIAANLRALRGHGPAGCALVGALLMDKVTLPARLKWIGDASGSAVRLLGLTALRALAEETGWTTGRVEDGPIHHIAVLEQGGA